MNMFEIATRNQLRFPSTKGLLSVEQLWTVPLRSKDGFNLNEVAKSLNASVRTLSFESFVDVPDNKKDLELTQLRLDIVKHIINVLLTEESENAQRAKNKREREKLLEILAEKQEGKLSALSEEELKQRIAQLPV